MKLEDLFADEHLTKSYLKDQFTNSKYMLEKVETFSPKEAATLAVMVAGYTIANEGAGIADVEDVALLSRANDLYRKHHLPIQRAKIESINRNGNKTKRQLCYIERGQLELLKTNEGAKGVCREVRTLVFRDKAIAENRKFDRLLVEYPNHNKLFARIINRKLKLPTKHKAQFIGELGQLITKYDQSIKKGSKH